MSETPSLTILSEEQKFNRDNLLQWNTSINQLLGAKGLLELVIGMGNPGVFQGYPYPYPGIPYPPQQVCMGSSGWGWGFNRVNVYSNPSQVWIPLAG